MSYETLLGWLAKGRAQREGPFRDFYTAVIAAETKAEIEMLRIVKREAKLDAKHAKWMLSHRWRDRWADNPAKVEITGAGGGPVKVEDARSRLLAKLEQLVARQPKKE